MSVLLVTGSRSIKDDAYVASVLDSLPFEVTALIHGDAAGVDKAAGRWATAKGIPVRIRRPDFKAYPVSRFRWKAYTLRDFDMVREADTVVAIWDGHSSGTRITFEYAEKLGKLHRVVVKE